jgi:hypothetical protein
MILDAVKKEGGVASGGSVCGRGRTIADEMVWFLFSFIFLTSFTFFIFF